MALVWKDDRRRTTFTSMAVPSCSRQHAAGYGTLDQAIEHDHQRFVLRIGETIDLLVQPVQLRVVNPGIAAARILAPSELVEGDIEDAGSLENRGKPRDGDAVFLVR